ncbi:MAG: GIY-YIG nuclease family protein [Chloroflexi bacterium]|nr:GIY-YIG nuclease family protein [Chloroflexota bacterium]
MGYVYILHFDRKYQHSQHYVGYTKDIDRRMAQHRRGWSLGTRYLMAVKEAGIGWFVTVFDGGRDLERKIKRSHNTARYCPVCQAERRRKAGEQPALDLEEQRAV